MNAEGKQLSLLCIKITMCFTRLLWLSFIESRSTTLKTSLVLISGLVTKIKCLPVWAIIECWTVDYLTSRLEGTVPLLIPMRTVSPINLSLRVCFYMLMRSLPWSLLKGNRNVAKCVTPYCRLLWEEEERNNRGCLLCNKAKPPALSGGRLKNALCMR